MDTTTDLISGKLFYAEVPKGFLLKVLFDALAGAGLTRGYFSIDEKGVSLRQSDQPNVPNAPPGTILYDVFLKRENFRNYVFFPPSPEPFVISMNLKHLQAQMKNTKKKDSVTIYIDKSRPGNFSIVIRPEGSTDASRHEINGVAYQLERDYVFIESPGEGYDHPMVIDSVNFQKIKRLTTMGKVISISIQKSNYLSFRCDSGAVMNSELGFGQLLVSTPPASPPPVEPKPKSRSKKCPVCSKTPSRCACVCEECEEYLMDCRCVAEVSASAVATVEVAPVFHANYYSSILNKLMKLPSLGAQMKFYAPSVAMYPLRVKVVAGQANYMFGTINVYVKDVETISHDLVVAASTPSVVSVATTPTAVGVVAVTKSKEKRTAKKKSA